MSHDRGCPCGRDNYEYDDCTKKNCIKKDLWKDVDADQIEEKYGPRPMPKPGLRPATREEKIVKPGVYEVPVKNSGHNL